MRWPRVRFTVRRMLVAVVSLTVLVVTADGLLDGRLQRALSGSRARHQLMEERFPWLGALVALAKLTAAATLFAYLLRRGGLRPAAVTTVTSAHLMALFCVVPVSMHDSIVPVLAAMITLGTCTYAVLAVDRPWLQAAIVLACFLMFGAFLARESVVQCIVLLTALAYWTGLMVTIRHWARTHPDSKTGLPETL